MDLFDVIPAQAGIHISLILLKRITFHTASKAGIHKLLILNNSYKLDSGLRRNDELIGR